MACHSHLVFVSFFVCSSVYWHTRTGACMTIQNKFGVIENKTGLKRGKYLQNR